jgi:hypothetical protein
MMRLLIDEDTAVQIIEPLRHILLGHEVVHISGLSWKGKKDLRVLPDARNAGFHALITRDRAQFSDPRECDATRSAGRDRPAQAVLPETWPSAAAESSSLTSSRSTL